MIYLFLVKINIKLITVINAIKNSKFNSITNPSFVQDKFGGTHSTASRALKLLESLGILKEEANPKDKRTHIYIAEKILDILG